MARRGFNKQIGLGNDLKHPTDINAKQVAVLCSMSYFAVICLNSETVPLSSFPILIAVAIAIILFPAVMLSCLDYHHLVALPAFAHAIALD